MQAVKNNESMEETDASVKNEKVTGEWMIENDYKCNRC